MGLYLLNVSVDSPDRYPDYIPENLSINDQESVIEILVEKVMGLGDVFVEYDDPDKEDHNGGSSFKIQLTFFTDAGPEANIMLSYRKKKKFPEYQSELIQHHYQKDTPPPEV
ncbi:MAG: hypothetical protein VX772_04680 [Bacteroidota bacterium]|nr:hypothetical protein [Bacteroidota bacterium]